MRILVADQDVEQRQALVKRLEQLGHAVKEALSESEILEICRSKSPDLMFIDKEISGVKAAVLIPRLRQLGGHAIWVPIIVLGSTLNDAEMRECLLAGADDFLVKPPSEIQLLCKVRSAERHLSLKEEVFQVAHNLVVANRALESIVTQDVLTGLSNSNSFDDALERDWFQAKKTKTPLTLIMANLDYFQAYNQSYGAVQGDNTIKKVAELWKSTLGDDKIFIARLSGETFAVLLPHVATEAGLKEAERLREALLEAKIPHVTSGASEYLTASFGVSTAEPPQYTSPWDLKEASDFALFQAKHYGRNRCYNVPVVEENGKTGFGAI